MTIRQYPETQQNACGKHAKADSKAQSLNETLVDRLFMRFSAIYGHKWNSTYPHVNAINIAKREWQQSIEYLTIHQVKQGVEYCKKNLKWPPSLPEFIQSCKEDDTLPTINKAFREACHASSTHKWSHPVVYHAAKDVGFHLLRTESERYTRPQFERSYQIYTRRFKNGEKLSTPILKGLPEEVHRRSSPKTAEKYMNQIMKILEKNKDNGKLKDTYTQ